MIPRIFDLDPAHRSVDPDYLDARTSGVEDWNVYLDGVLQQNVLQARASKGRDKGCVVKYSCIEPMSGKPLCGADGKPITKMLWGFVEFREARAQAS